MRIPTLTIKPRRGVRAPKHNGRRIIAIVDIDSDHVGDWSHPILTLATEYREGEIADLDRVNVRFQRHRKGHVRDYDNARYPRGFLGGVGTWSQSYGGEILCGLGMYEIPKFLRRALDLLDAAREKARKRRTGRRNPKDPDCDLLDLIVGLRLLGIPVRVHAPAYERVRDMRRAERAVRRLPAFDAA